MKILQISEASTLSGGAFQMLELTMGMIKRGYDVSIACRPDSKIKQKTLEFKIKHIELPLSRDNDVFFYV